MEVLWGHGTLTSEDQDTQKCTNGHEKPSQPSTQQVHHLRSQGQVNTEDMKLGQYVDDIGDHQGGAAPGQGMLLVQTLQVQGFKRVVEGRKEDPSDCGTPADEEVTITYGVGGFLSGRQSALPEGVNTCARRAALVLPISPRSLAANLPIDVINAGISDNYFVSGSIWDISMSLSLVYDVSHCILPHELLPFLVGTGGVSWWLQSDIFGATDVFENSHADIGPRSSTLDLSQVTTS